MSPYQFIVAIITATQSKYDRNCILFGEDSKEVFRHMVFCTISFALIKALHIHICANSGLNANFYYLRPSALGMSVPLMDQGNQVDQGDQSGTSITTEQGGSWDRKPVFWDRKPGFWTFNTKRRLTHTFLFLTRSCVHLSRNLHTVCTSLI